MALKFSVGIGTIDNGCACFSSQVYMTRDKVCVEVRFKYVFDFGTFLLRLLDVRLRLPQRINDRYFATVFYVIRPLCEATGIYLFYFHVNRFC